MCHVLSGVTSHWQPRKCPGIQNGKGGGQSDPNYVSRLLCGDNVKVSQLVWRTRYTDTFCNAVDCRFELALEVQRWTRARSECLPGGAKIIFTALHVLLLGRRAQCGSKFLSGSEVCYYRLTTDWSLLQRLLQQMIAHCCNAVVRN